MILRSSELCCEGIQQDLSGLVGQPARNWWNDPHEWKNRYNDIGCLTIREPLTRGPASHLACF